MIEAELTEVCYILPIANLASVRQHGLPSHERVSNVTHQSIADDEIQQRRAKRVPNGLRLHEYVNLYICARNPMLWKRINQRGNICVLRVDPRCHSYDWRCRDGSKRGFQLRPISELPHGIGIVDRDRTFATYWNDDDIIEYWRKKSAKCAEVLVPYVVPPVMVRGAYVCGERAVERVQAQWRSLPTEVSTELFFGRA